jgi:protein ImuB
VSANSGRVGVGAQQRILAVVFPELLSELVLQGLQLTKHVPLAWAATPHAVVVTDSVSFEKQSQLESKTELDAVNVTAHRLGIRPHQTIGQASAIVENLRVYPLPSARVLSALQHIAEMALTFGSPVSFQAPDTVWVDISGSSHLFGGERELAMEFAARIKELGHSIRISIAPGPWLARAFARHSCFEGSGILQVDSLHAERLVAELPIIALPIQREAITWFARLGLLSIDDLRKLPASALAARLEDQAILDLIRGRDETPLRPYHPEELPGEELFWEDPLESVEPLLFVLKGLSSRLGARLESRGQAVQELLLTIHYDPSLATLQLAAGVESTRGASPAPHSYASVSPAAGSVVETGSAVRSAPRNSEVPSSNENYSSKRLSFKFASPLCHAEDLERVIRARLQRQALRAPALGLSLQATSVTETRVDQMRLSNTSRWDDTPLDSNPRTIAVLVAELSADLGGSAVGVLAACDSHLLEKSSSLAPIQSLPARKRTDAKVMARNAQALDSEAFSISQSRPRLPQLPTRLFNPPIEVHARIREEELWVIRERPFVVRDIRFEQRLEEVEWWDSTRIFRDYFRVWLAAVEAQAHPSHLQPGRHLTGESQAAIQGARSREDSGGIEALVYRDRARGRSYLQAIYD